MYDKQSMKQVKIWTIAPLNSGAIKGVTLFLKLVNTETLIPVFIDQSENQAILKALNKRIPSNRPFIHGTLLSLMEYTKLSLFRVEIYNIHDNILLARLLFKGQSYSVEKPLISPVTPSDACVLATLAKCPIYVAENVIEQIGVPVDIELDKFCI
ncbi:MAG: bifunctional nuclease family protein [Treponema sp.]|jgi:bifunctional DNase/RNase|nr:bifunctional nuclease family protein [Treponema sp.]